MDWKWDQRGVWMKNGAGSKLYRLLPGNGDEVAEYIATVDRAREIHQDLLTAKTNFLLGRANYQGAHENYGHLLNSLDVSGKIADAAAEEISAFFDPTTIAEEFRRQPDQLLKFVVDAVPRLEVTRPTNG